jgi:hypothetical protein
MTAWLDEHGDAEPGTTGKCAILPPVAGKRTEGLSGSFKLRSDAEAEPDKEEF